MFLFTKHFITKCTLLKEVKAFSIVPGPVTALAQNVASSHADNSRTLFNKLFTVKQIPFKTSAAIVDILCFTANSP